MFIQHNMAAMLASRQLKINTDNQTKHSNRLSSGYKINIAADNAAGLSISEKMRGQIRGLERAAQNAQDSASFIQVADGAMNETHTLIQRMRELTVQSLNDTYTAADRAAMAVEFDQLQSEIDKINNDTNFGALNVFEDHADAYYQIAGNRVWDAAQEHSIISPANDLVIKLGDAHNPSEYTITIPDGIYTTQELIDEIEDAFSNMVPPNPGLELEFTDDGFCNLNFESQDGSPVEIKSVEGGLAYLIYDCYNGNSSASLLGTTMFQGNYPLSITKGQNDELGFYVENTDGSGSTYVTITIPTGSTGKKDYTRDELIEFLNNELIAKNITGVTAKEYGDNCIQITGGSEKSITGLKGNMFKYETTTPVYTSVFYDNSKYGLSTKTASSVTGAAYYNTNTTKFKITTDNNTLRFKLNGAADYTTITLTPNKEYTMSELVTELNNQLKNANVNDKVNFSYSSKSVTPTNGTYGTYNYLIMRNTLTGSESKIEFDTSSPLYQKTYNTLFCDTNYEYIKTASYYQNGSNNNMKITGAATLNGSIPITSDKNTLSLKVSHDGTTTDVNVTIPAKTYSSLSDLVTTLNNQLTMAQKELISFDKNGSQLVIKGVKDTVTNITFNNKDGAYSQLFTGTTQQAKYEYKSGYGKEEYTQGGTAPSKAEMASITLSNGIPNASTTITTSNNRLYFTLNGQSKSVTLTPDKTYSRSELVAELNTQLQKQNLNLTASLSGDKLTLTTTLTGKTCTHSIVVNTRYGSGWSAFVGTEPATSGPTMPSTGSPTILRGVNDFAEDLTLTDDNNTMNLTYNGKAYTIKLDGTYTKASMATALQTAINDAIGTNSDGSAKIKVTAITSGLQLTATSNGYRSFSCSGKLYEAAFNKQIISTSTSKPANTKGTHSFSEAYIVGREDMTKGPIEIVSGSNDKFILDFTYKSSQDAAKDYMKTFELTIPEGTYSGDKIADILQEELLKALKAEGLDDTFDATVKIGGHNTGVIGSNDSKALHITIKEKTGKQADTGTYIIDGIRGSAAYFTFYKTNGKPVPSYVIGSEDLSDGVSFSTENNVLTFTADGVNYSYTFDEEDYTAERFLEILNDKFTNGDDAGNKAPLKATLEDGYLKISHKIIGNHTIKNMGGTAKGVVFYHEESRESLEAFMLQIGANSEQAIELSHLRVSTSALGINSITISRPKYAQKALQRLDEAITKLNSFRSSYGAYQNRLEHIISGNQNTAENLQASESRIRDADIAEEMVQYSKSNILAQAAQAMLAQANQNPNNLLKLLQ